MKNCYDPDLDEEIFKILENKNNETGFNTLVKLCKKTPRTISKHLVFLENDKNNIIIWKKNYPGEKGSIKFSPDAIIKRKYGFLSVDYSNKRGICKEWKTNTTDKEIKMRKKKTILFLLIAFAYGYTGYRPTSKPQPGDIVIKDNKGKFIDVSVDRKKGFSIEDLDRQDSQLSAIHSILRLNRFTKSEMIEMLEELKKNNDIILRPILGSDGKEERYDIEDDVLKNLLIWCCNILSNFVGMMKQYWYIIGKKPKSNETKWLHFVMGEEITMNLFQKIEENRFQKKSIRELYREYHFKDTVLDKSIIDRDLGEMEAYYRQKYNLDIFTKKGMDKYIFTQSKESFALRLHCDLIASDKEKYQELVKEGKYKWILEELLDIINPPFSRSKYQVKLT